MPKQTNFDDMWRGILTARQPIYKRYRWLQSLIPAERRCKNCHAPFSGLGGRFMRLFGFGQYNRNPRFCNY